MKSGRTKVPTALVQISAVVFTPCSADAIVISCKVNFLLYCIYGVNHRGDKVKHNWLMVRVSNKYFLSNLL